MNNDTITDRADRPLQRADIEQRIQEVGGSNKLDMRGQNLQEIDLSGIDLSGASLSFTNLYRANLYRADLGGANLSSANLREANLGFADLGFANLSRANLSSADLIRANLAGAKLNQARLRGARLSESDLGGAHLNFADLRGAHLSGADLGFANLDGAKLSGADFEYLTDRHKDALLRAIGIRWYIRPAIQTSIQAIAETCVQVRIVQEPLTAQKVASILSILTDLHTRCWLIAQGRFADVIVYSQTKASHFVEEAHLVIEKITHNSPADFKFNLNADASPQGLVEALKTGIDAVIQTPHRWQATKLENQLKELEIQKQSLEIQELQADKGQSRRIEAERAKLEKEKALLDLEKQRMDIEKQKVDLQKERLELETQRLNYALETAKKMLDFLQPEADAQTKTMLVQTLLPSLLQMGESKGLELVLPQLALPQPAPQEPGTHKDSAE